MLLTQRAAHSTVSKASTTFPVSCSLSILRATPVGLQPQPLKGPFPPQPSLLCANQELGVGKFQGTPQRQHWLFQTQSVPSFLVAVASCSCLVTGFTVASSVMGRATGPLPFPQARARLYGNLCSDHLGSNSIRSAASSRQNVWALLESPSRLSHLTAM